MYDDKLININVIPFNDLIYTNCYDKNIPREDMHRVCLAIIRVDYFIKFDRKTTLKYIWKNANIL